MDMLLFIVWSITSCSIIFGYIYYVNNTLQKIRDDKSLSYKEARKRVDAKQEEIANIGICMALPFIGILFGGLFGLIAIIIADTIIN